MDPDAAVTEAALGLLQLQPALNQLPQKRKLDSILNEQSERVVVDDDNGGGIRCICGFSHDDGFSIACDDCGTWVHSACFDIDRENVPNEWRCWECRPRPVDKEKAMRTQMEKLRLLEQQIMTAKRPSPGVEKKRKQSGQKKRRNSVLVVDDQPQQQPQDDQPRWTQDYVHVDQDIVPEQETRDKLRRQATQWRGVTAISPYQPVHLDSDSTPPQTCVQQLPDSSFSHPTLSLGDNPQVRPPSYGLHTTCPIPSEHLIAPYKSTITPSSAYLSNPLNAYAHMGMPKTFVHLMGPPLDLSLDARTYGNESRFVRNGCRPNAVLRPLICSDNPETLSFGVFALRDLKANEEVILGWEWDDGNVIHNLPAIISTPNMFPLRNTRPEQLHHYHSQMTSILHSLSSTFVTCACGASAKDCALNQMAAFVDGDLDHSAKVDLGPLVGCERGFRTRERVPNSGGMSGVEMCRDRELEDVGVEPPTRRRRKGKEHPRSQSPPSAVDADEETHIPYKHRKRWMSENGHSFRPPPPPEPPEPEPGEPPNPDVGSMDVDHEEPTPDTERQEMPPPPPPLPIPSSSHPRLISNPGLASPSPSTPFSKLSLLSPIVTQEGGETTPPQQRQQHPLQQEVTQSPVLEWTPMTGKNVVEEPRPKSESPPPPRISSSPSPPTTEIADTEPPSKEREPSPTPTENEDAEMSIDAEPAASEAMVVDESESPQESEQQVQEAPEPAVNGHEEGEVEDPQPQSPLINGEAHERQPLTLKDLLKPPLDLWPPPRSPSPRTPTPPPKVKISLSDFARRKREERERFEEERRENERAQKELEERLLKELEEKRARQREETEHQQEEERRKQEELQRTREERMKEMQDRLAVEDRTRPPVGWMRREELKTSLGRRLDHDLTNRDSEALPIDYGAPLALSPPLVSRISPSPSLADRINGHIAHSSIPNGSRQPNGSPSEDGEISIFPPPIMSNILPPTQPRSFSSNGSNLPKKLPNKPPPSAPRALRNMSAAAQRQANQRAWGFQPQHISPPQPPNERWSQPEQSWQTQTPPKKFRWD